MQCVKLGTLPNVSLSIDQGISNTSLTNELENQSKLFVISPLIWHFKQATNKHCKHIIDLQANVTLISPQHTVWCGFHLTGSVIYGDIFFEAKWFSKWDYENKWQKKGQLTSLHLDFCNVSVWGGGIIRYCTPFLFVRGTEPWDSGDSLVWTSGRTKTLVIFVLLSCSCWFENYGLLQ